MNKKDKSEERQTVVVDLENRRLTAAGFKQRMYQNSDAPRSRSEYRGRRRVKTD